MNYSKYKFGNYNIYTICIDLYVIFISVMDSTTAGGFTVEYTAKKILDAIVNKKNELIISQFLPKLGIFLRHILPSIYFKVMERKAIKT